jgi:IS5 family transposase
MAERFVPTSNYDFLGRFAHEAVVSPEHFLVKARDLIDWRACTRRFVALYPGKARLGRPPYEPVLIVKCLLLAYMYNLSERGVEEFCRYNVLGRVFLDISWNAPVPDHSTLSLFRSRIETALSNKKSETKKQRDERIEGQYRELFDDVLVQAVRLGIQWGKIQAVDAVHTVANVNNDKDRIRQSEGRPPADPDASLVHKGERPVTEADGKVVRQQIKYHGYKTHVSMDTETRLITALTTSTGNASDGERMPQLMRLDKAVGVPAESYTADRAYDSGENHLALETAKKGDAIKLNRLRTEKKDDSKQKWLDKQADPTYGEGLAERYTIEAKFGEAKAWHGFGRCRYRGRPGHIAQAFLTCLVLNLKRIVYLVAGVQLRHTPRRRLARAVA